MGVSKEMRELLNSALPLPVHQEFYIRAKGFLSGSARFGVATDCSDSDYILLQKDFDGMKLDTDVLRYGGGELYRFDGYTSWYVKCSNGAVLNLLVMESKWLREQYVYATTRVIFEMAGDSNYAEKIRDKSFRVEQFKKFKGEYATACSRRVD